jgi:O-antigen ligase
VKAAALLVCALLGWTLFAFGGVYLWGAVVTVCGSALLVLLSLPCLRHPHWISPLDALLAGCLLYAGLQLVPLPGGLAAAVSPSSANVLATLSLTADSGGRPISIDPPASVHASIVMLATLVTFWSARALFGFGGIRTVARGVAAWGLIAALLGILQDASGTRQVYWSWTPLSDGPPGFGPFINRNHFAAWIVMAISLTLGYLAARTHPGDRTDRYRSFAARVRRRLDGRTVWLLIALTTMVVALILTLSRSGLAAAVAATIVARILTVDRRGRRRSWWWAAALPVVVLAILWTGPLTLVNRWQSADIGQEGRTVIWRETLPIVKDFWLTGTGVGTYGTAMTVYQRSERRVHFNQAHNHYLQMLAEGGLLLLVLVAAAAVAFVRSARERIGSDHTGMLWIRVGAAAGLTGLAVQSLWETAARMPADALLGAVLAALVLHTCEPEAVHHAGQAEAA